MKALIIAAISLTLVACATPAPPKWGASPPAAEREYDAYVMAGTSQLVGQAFLAQAGGGVVKAAGRSVSLDPATTIGAEWWSKAGQMWIHRDHVPPSPGFLKARRTTVADADGRFKFKDLPAGRYYVRTEVTWEIGGYNPTQGGLVFALVDVGEGEVKEIILNQMPR